LSPPKTVTLPDGRIWLRVADPDWPDPLDPSFAAGSGGRWNPPDLYPVLYLNADLATARLQLDRLVAEQPYTVDDLADDAYTLVASRLPKSQRCADAVSQAGLEALGLPASYPVNASGEIVGHDTCQAIGEEVYEAKLRGVWCISALTSEPTGRELAWFPASSRFRARPVWAEGQPLGQWREAISWSDIGLSSQPNPTP
jgi:hypothetical protein